MNFILIWILLAANFQAITTKPLKQKRSFNKEDIDEILEEVSTDFDPAKFEVSLQSDSNLNNKSHSLAISKVLQEKDKEKVALIIRGACEDIQSIYHMV